MDAVNMMGADRVFLLRDYSTLTGYWHVRVRQGLLVDVQAAERDDGEPVHGLLEQWKLAGTRKTMGFFSAASLESVPNAPDYSRHLLLIIDGQLLGDGLAMPRIRLRKGYFEREITVNADDRLFFHVHYASPWFREIFRKLNLGGTPEYDPVDFLERLVEIVALNRRPWIDIV